MLLTALLAVGCATDDDWEADGNAVGPESFSWTRGAVEETRIAFLRNLGVGYGYNAVSGRYCNYADIRCQILNRRQLEKAAQASGMTLWHTDYTSRSYSTSQVAYNEHDYVATFNLGRESSFNYIIYKEEQTYRQNILEDGLRQSFYFSTDDYEQVATQWLDVGNTIDAMSAGLDPYQILTRSFADAVEHLGESTEPAAVDSFLQVYGTHVVVRTAIGGRLHIDLKNDMKRYGRKMQEEEFSSSDLFNAFRDRNENRELSEQYAWIEHSSMNISAYGGDQSVLQGLIGEQQYDGSRNFDPSVVAQWRQGITFVPDDEYASNAEMIDMEVRPIWEFMFDGDAIAKVKQRIQSDATKATQQLGSKNFFSCSFPVRYDNPECLYTSATEEEVMNMDDYKYDNCSTFYCVHIVSGGRYVAVVCHEYIGGVEMWVAYPVYDGVTKLYCGLGVDNSGQAYRVYPDYTLKTDELWTYSSYLLVDSLSEMVAEPLPVDLYPQTDCFYFNNGELCIYPVEGIDYDDAQPMLYCEAGKSVRPDGSINVKPVPVYKLGTEFIIMGREGDPCDFVGWHLLGYEDDYTPIYRRNEDYVGYYNPTEMRPVGN